MKNLLKIFGFVLLVITFNSCDDGVNSFSETPTDGWVEFSGSGSATISLVTESLELPININVPVYSNGLNIGYSLEAVQGDFNQIVSTATSTFADPAADTRTAAIELNFSNLESLTDVVVFDVVLTSVDAQGVSVGIDETSLTRYRISTPCPIVTGSSYTGTASSGGTLIQDGYTANLTDLGNLTYSLDVSWGPLFVDTACGGCLGGVESYVAPITFTIDPGTFVITVLSGGEPSGVGNPFDIAYTMSGTGSYNSCDDIIELTVTESGIFTNSVTANVILQ